MTMTVSPSGTTITSAAFIVDENNNTWGLTGNPGQVVTNGAVDTTTSGVIKLWFDGAKVWQENTSNLWWYKTNPTDAWLPAAGQSAVPWASADGTVVTIANTPIVDVAGNKWTMTALPGKVAVNGVTDATTGGVKALCSKNGQVWQENTANMWWYKVKPTDTWLPAGGTATSPLAPPQPLPVPLPSGAPTPPPQAAAVRYTLLTLGPNITVGGNWQKNDHDGGGEPNITINADGSVTVAGGADTWNAQMQSAQVFGGGFYAEATMTVPGPTSHLSSWTGSTDPGNQWPSWWANSTDNLMETDFTELLDATEGHFNCTLINWTTNPNVGWGQELTAPNGNTLHGPNVYGFLWVPATDTTPGVLSFWLNNQQVGQPFNYTKANPGSWGFIDGKQMRLRFGAGANSPATFSNIKVWQKSTAANG